MEFSDIHVDDNICFRDIICSDTFKIMTVHNLIQLKQISTTHYRQK